MVISKRSVSSLGAAWGLDGESRSKRVQMLYLLTFLEEVGSGSSRIQLSPLYSPSTPRIVSESVTDLHCCRTGCNAPCVKKFMADTADSQMRNAEACFECINPSCLPSLECQGIDCKHLV